MKECKGACGTPEQAAKRGKVSFAQIRRAQNIFVKNRRSCLPLRRRSVQSLQIAEGFGKPVILRAHMPYPL